MPTQIENQKGVNGPIWIISEWLYSQSQAKDEKTTLAIYHQYQNKIISGKGATMWISYKSNGLVLDREMATHTIYPKPTYPTSRKPLPHLGDNHSPSTSTPCTTRSHRWRRYRSITKRDTYIESLILINYLLECITLVQSGPVGQIWPRGVLDYFRTCTRSTRQKRKKVV